MMPIATNTQITQPTQVSSAPVALPATNTVRILPDAVAPSVPDAKLGPDYKGNGGYASSAQAPANSTAPVASTLSVPIPASFSTANASLSAGAMLATQFLSQDSGESFFQVYEQMVAASQVKYKPSDATLPQPAPNNLFSKMLAEEQSHTTQNAALQQATPKAAAEHAAPPAQTAAPAPKTAPRKSESAAPHEAIRAAATQAYGRTTSRNKAELEDGSAIEPLAG